MTFLAKNFKDARPKEIGTKARNLFRLKKHFLVPDFVVVTTDGFRDYRKHGKISLELDQELRQILKFMLKKGPVAVRSSCTAEDMPGVSFAGMYTTSLNIKDVDSGIEAIISTWDSVDNERVRKYREHMNITSGDMAVIIQKQLEPEVSGVIVTQSPLSVSEILIECCSGLGEKLVSGKISPTRYHINLEGKIECKGKNLLTLAQVKKLTKTGKEIERLFKAPQDIEWAFEDDKLFILQARPITSVIRAAKNTGRVWCNANVRETIPDPISPMGYSFFEKIWFPGIVIDTFGFPLTIEQYEKYPPVERVLGRLYWNMNNTAAYGRSIEPILKFTGAGTAIDPQLGMAMENIDVNAIPSPLSFTKMFLFSLKAMIRMPWFLTKSFFMFRHAKRVIDQACVEIDQLAQNMCPTADFIEGTYNVRNWIQIISGQLSRRYFSGILLSVFYLAVLSKLLGWRMGKQGEAFARMTTYGLLDKTGEMVLALRSLAVCAHSKISCVNDKTLDELYDNDPDFHRRYDAFIAEFGHRGPAEFDVASITWHEDRFLVYSVLKNPPRSKKSIERSRVIQDILKDLPSFERYVTRLFIPRIETLTAIRENGKHYVFKILSKVKDQLLILEDDLIKKGLLEKARDIFFLCLDDLEAIREGTLSKEKTLKLLSERKAEWYKYLNIKVPDIVYEDGEQVFLSTRGKTDLSGTPLSYGRVCGRARIIESFADTNILEKGDIMITNHTDPGWTPLFSVVSGVVIEVGGLICHAAMVARELGLPAIVLPGAMSSIPDKAMIELDADTGKVALMPNDKTQISNE
jgi:phosphohistidine swiveling domain-containing protein